jgi:hypothetical protein
MKLLSILSLLFSINSFAMFKNHHPNRLVVKSSSDQFLKHELIKSSKHLFGKYYVIFSDDIHSLKRDLEQNKNISNVDFDYKADKSELPNLEEVNLIKSNDTSVFNDPLIGNQWALRDASQNGMHIISTFGNRRSAPEKEVIVAVVDTGVDFNHPDLPMWTNENEIPGNGIDDDNNGYIDDIHGINTLVRDSEGKATMNIMDTHSHGTHVSGSIAAIQNNALGVAGIASKAKIMALRTVPNSSDETDVDVTEAFIYAAKNGAKVINCSFGKSVNERGMMVRDAINHIGKEFGVLVVAAAGNSRRNIDDYPAYPASFDSENLLVVASSTSSGGLSWFSNYGIESVDIVGPGSGIYSTIPGARYSSMSGTSMASPNVAGVAAEVLANHPNLSPVELKQILMNSSTKLPTYESKVGSGGRAHLEAALDLAREY